jgi:hypothetical protein
MEQPHNIIDKGAITSSNFLKYRLVGDDIEAHMFEFDG